MDKDQLIINEVLSKMPEEYNVPEGTNYLYNTLPFLTMREGAGVLYSSWNLQSILDMYRNTGRLAKCKGSDLYKYISFSRFKRGSDKLFCDWCSIVNGCTEYLYDKTLLLCDTRDIIDFRMTDGIKASISNFALSVEHLPPGNDMYSKIEVTDEDLEPFLSRIKLDVPFSNEQEYRLLEELGTLITFRKMILQFERRWCPFKHHAKIHYTRDHHKFDSHNQADVNEAMKILKEKSKIVDEESLGGQVDPLPMQSSIFEPYMNRLKEILDE